MCHPYRPYESSERPQNPTTCKILKLCRLKVWCSDTGTSTYLRPHVIFLDALMLFWYWLLHEMPAVFIFCAPFHNTARGDANVPLKRNATWHIPAGNKSVLESGIFLIWNMAIWWFPKMGGIRVPPNHPFLDGFSMVFHHPCGGTQVRHHRRGVAWKGNTMPWLYQPWLGMGSLYHLYIYCDDWGMVHMALFYSQYWYFHGNS